MNYISFEIGVMEKGKKGQKLYRKMIMKIGGN